MKGLPFGLAMTDTSRDHLLGAIERAVAAVNDPLEQAAAAVTAANDALAAAVTEARRRSVPWAEIAHRIGMRSQQAARQRYGHLEPDHRQKIKTWACPLPDPRRPGRQCTTQATYRHNMRKHLLGTRGYGGHELSDDEAERVLDELEYGTT